MKLGHLQTMKIAFREICEGEEPWVALGNFLNHWFDYSKERRSDLVSDPIAEAPENKYCQCWAAYCAASVEHLCHKYAVPCPEWVHNPKYVLSEPWYDTPYERVHEWLITSTPEEFKKRNIYSGDRMFLNKWEWREQYQHFLQKQKSRHHKKAV